MKIKIFGVLLACVLFAACAKQPAVAPAKVLPDASAAQQNTFGGVYREAVFHIDRAQGSGDARIDTSCIAQGYVGVSAVSESRLKFQVVFGEMKYNYDLPNDGTPTIYPLQSGNGQYVLRVMQNTSEQRFVEIYSETIDVTLDSEFEPYLRPSQMVNYTENSACVQLAAQMASEAEDDAAFVASVYEYIQNTIAYDYDKAQLVDATGLTGYLPDADSTLAEKKGICFDYAALTAAMLRSQGVPTRMVLGYVYDGALYHSWNMIYLQNSGWVSVKIEVPANKWQQIDLTFAATGEDDAISGEGDYMQLYVY